MEEVVPFDTEKSRGAIGLVILRVVFEAVFQNGGRLVKIRYPDAILSYPYESPPLAVVLHLLGIAPVFGLVIPERPKESQLKDRFELVETIIWPLLRTLILVSRGVGSGAADGDPTCQMIKVEIIDRLDR